MRSPAFTILFLLAAGKARAEEPAVAVGDTLDSVSAVAFGDELYAADDPFNALTFWRLGLFLDPDREDAGAVRFRLALAYEKGDRHAAAVRAWLDLAGRDELWSPQATYRAAMSALAGNQPGEARVYLGEVVLEDASGPWGERAAFMIPIVDLKAGNATSAQAGFDAFVSAHPASPYAERAKATSALLADPIRRRSPAVAGTMSLILPGSGQMYAGHVGDGVMALLANGLFGFWSYTLLRDGFEDDERWKIGSGVAMGSFTAYVWASNVVGAVSGAQRANRHAERRRNEAALEAADSADLQRDAEDVKLPE
jgi:TM2 domain-containing membrane protein YozV